ncbi:hypothetical protein B0H15DRAFT_868446 [Mycena belliarum]|uniref:Uncharacterized protein n=1 Tax=Mycena belliarum TaxID=1033014 RepID=A0AAD6TTH2_9AGAR|nr:hypothetical protein B0H15DRAFT_868446 [Mycena belliae]
MSIGIHAGTCLLYYPSSHQHGSPSDNCSRTMCIRVFIGTPTWLCIPTSLSAMSETKNSVGSSTAVEIHVQVPRQTIDKADNHEAASTLTISTLKYRSSGQRTATSQLESGRPDRDTVPPGLFRRFLPSELFCKILEGVNLILQLGSLLFWVFVVLLSAVCTNIFLFRRPLAYASQLEPILEQRRKCGDDARLSLCSRRSPLPNSVVEFGGSWQRYLGDKKKEWVWFAWLAGFLSAFVLVTLQISDKSDLATRVLAYMTFIAMLFSVMVNQYLFPCYLDSERANDIHYAYHLLECADAEISSTWNIHMLLSMSNVSTWW